MVIPLSVIGTAGINKGNILQNLLCDFANFARDNFVGLWKFCTFAFVNWNQIKKGGNGKQKDYNLDLVNFYDIK